MKLSRREKNAATSGRERQFLLGALSRALERPLGRIFTSHGSDDPPPGARIAAAFRCTVVLKGRHVQKCDFGRGPEDFEMKAGDVFLMSKGSWRLPRPCGPRHILVFHFFLPYLTCSHHAFYGETENREPLSLHFSTTTGLSGASLHLLNAVAEYAAQPEFPPSCHPLITCLLAQVHELLQNEAEPLRKSEMTYRALLNYLGEHFRDPITRESAAAYLQIHPAHVSRLFRTVGRTSFVASLLARRIEYAMQLMDNPSLSVKEIATTCGFQSADYFREIFRKATGRSPQAYRSASRKIRKIR
jgi:AraC-like DNA-binding protein